MKRIKHKALMTMMLLILVAAFVVGCTTGSPGASSGADSSANTSDDSKASDGGGNSAASGEEVVYKFGCSDSMTGPGAPYGLPGTKAVELAVEQINNEGGFKVGDKTVKLEVVTYDNKSDAGEAVSTVQKLTDIDEVEFILGWGNSTSTIAGVQTIKNRPVTMIVGNARSPEVLLYSTGNVFRSATVNCYDPIEDCKYIQKNGVNKVAMMCFFNDSGYSIHANNVMEAFKSIGVEVVAQETMNAGESDFLSQMTNIKNTGAEAVYMAGNIEESALALRQLRELGSDIPMYTYSSGTGPQWLEICTNEQMTGCYAIRPAVADVGPNNDMFNDEAKAFIEAYEAKFGENPSQAATNTYDNVWILKAAMQRAGTLDYKDINAALWELTPDELDARTILPYDSIDGKLFDSIGQAYHPYSVLKWDPEYQNAEGEQAGNWNFEALIGMNLGPEFHHAFMQKLASEKGVAEFSIDGFTGGN